MSATWIQHARRYVATGDQRHLDRAIDLCADAEIVTFLRNQDLQGRRQVNPSHFEGLIDRLTADHRLDEACVVNLLGFRFVASAMFELETYDAEKQAFIERTCAALAAQSATLRFPECEALFTGLLATGTAKLRRDSESFGLFDRAISQARYLVENAELYASLLAGLLNNYGNALRFAGRTDEAGHVLEESATIRRRLAEDGSDRSRRELASTLSNLAAVYGAQRRYQKAEPLLTEAVVIQRSPSAMGSMQEQRSLAGTLSNLAFLYTEQRRFNEARQATAGALRIRRELAANEPDAHLPDVATTLSNYGMLLDDLREHAAAVMHLREAVSIRRRLAESQPTVFEADLAMSLNNLANALLVTGEAHDIQLAFDAYNEALSIRRRLAEDNPELYDQAVAQSLGNLAGLRRQVGQLELAIDQMGEVATILRKLCDAHAQGHKRELAGCLNNLGSTLFLAGRHTEARDVLTEAAALFQDLAAEEPEAYNGHVAGSLNDLSLVLSKLGQYEDALETAERAIHAGERAVSHLHLSKGDTSGAYWLVLADRCRRGSPAEVFDALVALRSPKERLGGRRNGENLAAATHALLEVSNSCGRRVILVAVDKLSGDDVFFGVLTPDDENPFRYVFLDSFAAKARELLSLVFAPFNDDAARGGSVDETRVAVAGHEFWQALPDFVQDTLHPDHEHVVLLCGDADSLDLPWEGCRFGPNSSDWLGLHRYLPRIPELSPEALRAIQPVKEAARPPTACIVCPWDVPGQVVLPGARDEAMEAAGLLSCAGYMLLPAGAPLIGREATASAIIDLLSTAPQIFHFCGHGDIVRGERSLVVWGESEVGEDHAFFDRARLLEAQVNSDRRKLSTSTSVVVLNACWAGRGRAFGGQREDLAAAFLEQGASCVIACPTPVHDHVARLLATLLYVPEFQDSRGLAYTFCRVRALVERKLRGTAHWWTWMWMRYHGNPFVCMPFSTVEPTRQRSVDDLRWRSKALALVRELAPEWDISNPSAVGSEGGRC